MYTEKTKLNLWDRVMMAITFAEADEAETAREIMRKRTDNQQRPQSRTRKDAEQRPELRV